MEDLLHRAFPVLDHGFVRVVDYMGDDGAVVQAARVSYGRGTRHTSDDRALIRYLMRHAHTTPFEMAEIKLHVKLPIFVARQWIRHRTASVNEYSGRYSVLDREFYVPSPSVLGVQDPRNRQGRGAALPPGKAGKVLEMLRRDAGVCYGHYERLIGAAGRGAGGRAAGGRAAEYQLARELARINLHLSFYTQWYWKTDLHNLLRFLELRMAPNAQHEIAEYARVMGGITEKWVPLVWEAFRDYRLEAARLSRAELAVVRRLVTGADPRPALKGLSAREISELELALGIDLSRFS
jgi:thymidylate synthase (FAD)